MQYRWRGISSVNEFLHAAATGEIPVHTKTIEPNRYCYWKTVKDFSNKFVKSMKNIIVKKDELTTEMIHESTFFQHDYYEYFAQVPMRSVYEMLLVGSSELSTMYLLEGYRDGRFLTAKDLKEQEKTEEKLIAYFDPEDSFFPKCLTLKIEDLVVLGSVLLSIDLKDLEERLEEKRELKEIKQRQVKFNARRENSDLKLIAALKEIILEQTDLKSQEQIIDFIRCDDRFKHIFGLRERTIQDRFSLGNIALKDDGD